MIPTLNQSKCLKMLEEWLGFGHFKWTETTPSSAAMRLPDGIDMASLTSLLLYAHKHGVCVTIVAHNEGGLAVGVHVPASDPPSLTKLRRRAHAGRLSGAVLLGAYAKERKEGA